MSDSPKVSDFLVDNSQQLIRELKQFEDDYMKPATSFQSIPNVEAVMTDSGGNNTNGNDKNNSGILRPSYGDFKCSPTIHRSEKMHPFFGHLESQSFEERQRLFQLSKDIFQRHANQQLSPKIRYAPDPTEPLRMQLSRSFSENKSLVNYCRINKKSDSRDILQDVSNSSFKFGNSFGLYSGEQQISASSSLTFGDPGGMLHDDNNLNYQNNSCNETSLKENLPAADITELCSRHTDIKGFFYCRGCEIVLCSVCLMEGSCATHECIDITTLHNRQMESLKACGLRTKTQLAKLQEDEVIIDRLQTQLRKRYDETIKNVEKTYAAFLQALHERKEDIFVELEKNYTSKLTRIQGGKSSVTGNISELNDAEVLLETLVPLPFNSKLVPLKFEVVQKIDELVSFRLDLKELSDAVASLNFYSNRQNVKSTIKNAFGFVGSVAIGERNDFFDTRHAPPNRNVSVEPIIPSQKNTFYNEPIAKPNSEVQGFQQFNESESRKMISSYPCLPTSRSSYAVGDGLMPSKQSKFFGNQLQATCPSPSIEATKSDSCSSRSSLYQGSNFMTSSSYNLAAGSNLSGLSSDELSKSIFPTINVGLEFRRIKMEYHCKFGEFGSEPGQFTEPSGVAVGRDNEILVADANNHRIQAFDCTGTFRRIIGQDLSRMGQEGKGQSEGDLVYPNRLAVNKTTGDLYVTERSPTHQVRVYDGSGRFVRRFGAHVLQHPRGITVDKLGRIVVIECKVMRVVIFNSTGSVLNRFVIEKKVNFPNGVAVNDQEEIFISDNRRHGVVVFDYQGAFLRNIGGIGVTNYPIGVGINSAGEVIIADNHNNFNVTLFSQDGKLIRALESRVKHAQCFDTALMGDGSIVLSSKDFRIYIYHYASYQMQAADEMNVGNFL